MERLTTQILYRLACTNHDIYYVEVLLTLIITRGAWAATGIVVCWFVCLFVTYESKLRCRIKLKA